MALNADDIAALPRDSRTRFLSALIDRTGAQSVLELGVWEGALAAHLLKRCKTIETYFMLDAWRHLVGWDKPFNRSDAEFDTIRQRALAATEFATDRRVILHGTTPERIGQIADDTLDFAYIDGDHTLRGITIDLALVWPKLRDGAVLVCDDFTAHPWQHGRAFAPSLVFPYALHFAEAQGALAVAPGLNQCVLVKGAGGYTFHDLTGLYGDVSLKRLSRKTIWQRLTGK